MVEGGSGVRAVARAYLVLGLAAACFALFALSLDPATYGQLQLQVAKDSNQQQQLEQGQVDCAPTAAEAMQMRADAVVLLMLGAAQAFLGMAAAVATSRVGTVCAQILSLTMAWTLLDVVDGVVDVAVGRCQGSYHLAIAASYGMVTVTFTVLFVAGLVVTLCRRSIGDASSPCGQASDHVAIELREIKDTANAPRQGAVSRQQDPGVYTVPNSTALAAVTPGKPDPAPSGGATTGSTGSPSPKQKQGKIKHGAASTSQAPPPRCLAVPVNLGSRPQLTQTAAPSPASTKQKQQQQQQLQYQSLPQLQHPAYMFQSQGHTAALPPSPASTQQQKHLQYLSLPQLQLPAYMFQYQLPAAPPQHQPHDVHGFHQAALTGALQNMSLSLQGSGIVGSTSDHRSSSDGGATVAGTVTRSSLRLLQLPPP